MAIYCLNYLTIRGDKFYVSMFDKCFKENGIEFKVENYHLKNTGHTHFDFSNYLCYWQEKLPDSYKLIGLVSIEPKNDYSFSAFLPPSTDYFRIWENWQYIKWDTRHDAEEMIVKKVDDNCIRYEFQTQWAPLPVIDQMSIDFPMLNFEFKYVEDGQSFAGSVVYEDGELLENIEITRDGQSMHHFLKDNFGYKYYSCSSCESLLDENETKTGNCPFCEEKITL